MASYCGDPDVISMLSDVRREQIGVSQEKRSGPSEESFYLQA